MIVIDGSALQIVGGLLLLAALFVLREFASGALRQAGEDFWERLRRRPPGQATRADGAATDLPHLCLDAEPAHGHPEAPSDANAVPHPKPLEEETVRGTASSPPPTPLRSTSNNPRKTA